MGIDLMSLSWFMTVGLIAGWLAGEMRNGEGFGLLGNCFIGVAGAFLGGQLLRHVDLGIHGMLGAVVTAFIGACVLLFVLDRVGLKA